MLQELEFHKSAGFEPVPELYAAKFSLDKLGRIRDKLTKLMRKHEGRFDSGIRYMQKAEGNEAAIIAKNNLKSFKRREDFAGMRETMDEAMMMHIDPNYRRK